MTKRFSKKAFTMIELLVCLVCLGFLTVGIAAFASAVETNAAYVKDREELMLGEYQDVLYLKTNGTADTTSLNNQDFLKQSELKAIGDTFNIRDYVTVSANQMIECSTDNTSVLTVQSGGTITARSEGVAYVKVNILTMGTDGTYHDTKNVKYIPIIVNNSTNLDVLADLKYYFYGGRYYSCWIYGE